MVNSSGPERPWQGFAAFQLLKVLKQFAVFGDLLEQPSYQVYVSFVQTANCCWLLCTSKYSSSLHVCPWSGTNRLTSWFCYGILPIAHRYITSVILQKKTHREFSQEGCFFFLILEVNPVLTKICARSPFRWTTGIQSKPPSSSLYTLWNSWLTIGTGNRLPSYSCSFLMETSGRFFCSTSSSSRWISYQDSKGLLWAG